MKYRDAIAAAIREWDNIRFHWNKSEASKKAVVILGRLIDESPYDDRLIRAIDWLMGVSNERFSYVVPLPQLKKDSALYIKLAEKLKTAELPALTPIVTSNIQQNSRSRVSLARIRPQPNRDLYSATSKTDMPLQISKHQNIWKKIGITDRPTGQHGRYEFTPDDFISTSQKGAAAGVVKKQFGTKDFLKDARYWIELGRMVIKSNKGRCFSCAGAAAYTLINDECFDVSEIAIMGSKGYDHYFICVGQSMGEIEAGSATAIDIWHANLKEGRSFFTTPARNFAYWEDAEIICQIDKSARSSLRAFAKEREQTENS